MTDDSLLSAINNTKNIESVEMATSLSEFRRKLISVNVSFVPNLKHQSKGEKKYLKLHKCKDNGEAYSAVCTILISPIIEFDSLYQIP